MSNPQDPRQDPLQDDEIALSRVLRALPAGEPSAKVDAAILAAATDAVAGKRAAAPTPSRRAVKAAGWLPTWAIGTAAAAVLAIGVGTQLRPPTAPDLAPTATAPAPAAAAAEDRMDVELIERRDEPTPTFPPPERPGEPQAGRAPPPPPPPPPAPVASPPPAEPAPFPQSLPVEEAAAATPSHADDDTTIDTVEVTGSRVRRADIEHSRLPLTVVERNAADAERREQAQLRQAHDEQAAAAAMAKAEDRTDFAPAPAPAPVQESPAAPPPMAAARAAAPADRRESEADLAAPVVGAVAAEAMAEAPAPSANDAAAAASAGAGADAASTGGVLGYSRALPPVADDVRLPPDQWFERIRERIRRGERADGLESLRLLKRTHPTLVLPADLAALR